MSNPVLEQSNLAEAPAMELPGFRGVSVCRTADSISATGANPSEADRRWEAERVLKRRDPMLALLYRAEAIAGHRAENSVSEASKLPMIADLLRQAIEEHTDKPFRNPLFPVESGEPRPDVPGRGADR